MIDATLEISWDTYDAITENEAVETDVLDLINMFTAEKYTSYACECKNYEDPYCDELPPVYYILFVDKEYKKAPTRVETMKYFERQDIAEYTYLVTDITEIT